MDRRVLVTGASGFLGRRLVARFAPHASVFALTRRSADVPAATTVVVDVADASQVAHAVRRLMPDVIVHAAAVNPGQGDAAAMWRANAAASRHIAEAAAAVGARLIAVSTDVVHDGRDAPYDDEAQPSPLDVYAASKAAGEALILAIDPAAAVVRTSLIYALDEMDRGTAGFAARIARGEAVGLFSDVVRCPIWVETLAEALFRLAGIDYAGVLNVAGRQPLTREQFGRKMLGYWRVEGPGSIESARAADVSDSIPLDLRLRVTRGEERLGMEFPGVDEVLGSHDSTVR